MTRRRSKRRVRRPRVRGLSSAEVISLRREHGPNALPDVRANVVLMFARKLFSPIPLLMVATLIVAALLKDYVTTACVAVLLLVNAVLGTVQEIRAHNAMRTLRASLIMTARVVRDGTPQQVASSDLVPGDIVRVRLGDSVPADVTVTTVADLMYDDSTITGESLPHAAQRGDELLCGSAIVRGEALCTVVRTGARSRTAARASNSSSVRIRAIIRCVRYSSTSARWLVWCLCW
jgi:magnesium-transporting ATPase (P-type)